MMLNEELQQSTWNKIK